MFQLSVVKASVVLLVVVVTVCRETEASDEMTLLGNSSMSGGAREDRLLQDTDLPSWLQNVPLESKVAKYRKRRFVAFPTGSKVVIESSFTLPHFGIGVAGKSALTLVDTTTFWLPTTSDFNIFGRRSSDSVGRLDVYKHVEEFISGFGLDGHACTLRAICEIAEMPFDHGIVGEIINVVFSVMTGNDGLHGSDTKYDEYSTAEYYGRHHGQCASIYHTCSLSITDMMSNAI